MKKDELRDTIIAAFCAGLLVGIAFIMAVMVFVRNAVDAHAADGAEVTPVYVDIVEGPESAVEAKVYHVDMSEEEGELLRTILALEAQDEPFEGKKAVVEVILNRVQSPEWPDTVYGVLSQKGQFATWKYRNDPYNTPGESEDDAIAEVLAETRTVLPDTRYVFFCTTRRGWMHDCIRIAGHWFGR